MNRLILKKMIFLYLISVFGSTHTMFYDNEGFNDVHDNKMYEEQKEAYKNTMIRQAVEEIREIISKVDTENYNAIDYYYAIYKSNNSHLDKKCCLIQFLRYIDNHILPHENQSHQDQIFMLIKKDKTFKKAINMLEKDAEDFMIIKNFEDTFKYKFFK